jgi:hypothetical protein
MLGGSVALAALSVTAIVATLHALSRRRAPPLVALGVCLATAVYARVVRPWHLRWGAQPADVERPLPGDEFLPAEGTDIAHAVTIDAPPERVWAWLAQIGQDRGGFYSYEWLENFAGCQMRNADRIHPEWQQRQIGDTVFLHPAGGMEVTLFEPGRAIGLKGWGTFVLEPTSDGRTRLIANNVAGSERPRRVR